MSRIHDALKLAQQELGRTPPPPDELLSDPTAGVEMRRAAVATLGERDEAAPPLTLEGLNAHCPVATWKPDPERVLFADGKDLSPGAEQFRTLRSRLYQIRDKQPLQTLLVASALPGEGKTFVSVNLTRAIVQQGNRSALLIDADLRRSRTHELLGAARSPGLTDYLRGEADVLSTLQRGGEDGLFFIGGGSPASNPVELISTGRLKTLLERLAPVFDWIILDSPPSVPLSDASLLAEMCDGVLMVVQSGVTPFDLAQKARQEFKEKQLVGVVLNRLSPGAPYASYYYGYAHDASNNGNQKA